MRVRGNETKHEQHLLFLNLVCIVCFFLGSIKRLYSGAEDIIIMTLHHLEESLTIGLYDVTLLLAYCQSSNGLPILKMSEKSILKGGIK